MKFMIKVVFVSIFLATLTACVMAEKNEPSHVAMIKIEKNDYLMFESELNETMSSLGLKGFRASPGLNEISGRDVFYVEYKKDISEKMGFLVATDIKSPYEFELRIFDGYFVDEQDRKNAVMQTLSFVGEFHGDVKIRK